MPQNAITSSNDVIGYLTAQHESIKELFVETLSASDPVLQKDAFTRLRIMLAVHETAEEMIVHPRVRRKIDGGDVIADARLAEEHDSKVVLQEIEGLEVGTAEFTKALTHLHGEVLSHAAKEEAEEFTLLGQLDADELKKLQVAVRVAESIAPTRPHPGVELAAVNFAVGPFASMLDRTRDAIAKVVA